MAQCLARGMYLEMFIEEGRQAGWLKDRKLKNISWLKHSMKSGHFLIIDNVLDLNLKYFGVLN